MEKKKTFPQAWVGILLKLRNYNFMIILASQGLVFQVFTTKCFRRLPFKHEMWLQKIRDKQILMKKERPIIKECGN